MAADIPTWPEFTTKTMVDWVVYDDDGQTLYSSEELPDHTLLMAETITDAGHVHVLVPVSNVLARGEGQEAYMREAHAHVREALAQKALHGPPAAG